MKTIFSIMVFVLIAGTQQLSAQKQETNSMLNNYYGITGALVAGDAKTASEKAAALVKLVDNFPVTSLTASQQKSWKSSSAKIRTDAEHISESQDIAHQRDHLNDLSVNLFALLKILKLNEKPVYLHYCPMKDAYWLSASKTIQNPYYGKQMLGCGSVKETLK